jgi:hypothetical protein
MKKSLLLFILVIINLHLFAQNYGDKASLLQKEIWGTASPEFKNSVTPANLSKESAVILARSLSLTRFVKIGHAEKTYIYHERVKINDKAALDDFSTIEYQKSESKTGRIFFFNFKEGSKEKFIGAKIIKPNGAETIVNTGEEVILQNENKGQKGKLAIPGLQVGDILDYYISSTDRSVNVYAQSYDKNDDLIMLAGEYPVLSYDLNFKFHKNIDIQCIYANGAPHFEESTNDNKDRIFTLKLKDLPKYKSQLWTSPLRQFPYIEIGSSYSTDVGSFMGRVRDKSPSRFESCEGKFMTYFSEYDNPDFDEVEKKTKDFFGSSKAMKSVSLDSLMKVVYTQWKYMAFCNYKGDEPDDFSSVNYRKANSLGCAAVMSMALTDMKIDHTVILASSRNSNTLENSYNIHDFEALIMINDTKPYYLCFDDAFTHFNEIPVYLQGEKAQAIHPKRKNNRSYTFTEEQITLPVTPSNVNTDMEQLKVSLLPANMQKLKIERTVSLTGAMRHGAQKQLIGAGDVDATFTTQAKGEPLEKRLSKKSETKKRIGEFQYAFEAEPKKMTENFTAEIKDQYDQKPQDVSNCKIASKGMDSSNPVFQYSASFVLDNLVKKAGNNYIIDLGKLAGGFVKIDEKDQTRTIDAYLFAARNITYNIALIIPAGYDVKDIEELNAQKSNKTGSFITTATVNGNTLNLKVSRIYNTNFEKAANWTMLKDVADTASGFESKKILLEKKG